MYVVALDGDHLWRMFYPGGLLKKLDLQLQKQS